MVRGKDYQSDPRTLRVLANHQEMAWVSIGVLNGAAVTFGRHFDQVINAFSSIVFPFLYQGVHPEGFERLAFIHSQRWTTEQPWSPCVP